MTVTSDIPQKTALLFTPYAKVFTVDNENYDNSVYLGALTGITDMKHTYSPPGRYETKVRNGVTTQELIDDVDEITIVYKQTGTLVDTMDLNYIIYIFIPYYNKKQAYRIKSITRNSEATYNIVAQHIKFDLKKVYVPYYPRHASDYDKYSTNLQKAYTPNSTANNVYYTGAETFRKIFSSTETDRRLELKVYQGSKNYVYAYYTTTRYNLPDYSFYNGFSFTSTAKVAMGLFGCAIGPAFAETYTTISKVTTSGSTSIIPDTCSYNMTDAPGYCVGIMTHGKSLYEELILDTPDGYALDFDDMAVTLYSLDKFTSKHNGYGRWGLPSDSKIVIAQKGVDVEKYVYQKSLSTTAFSGTMFMGTPEIGTYYINRIPYDEYGVIEQDSENPIDSTAWTSEMKRTYGIVNIKEVETNKTYTSTNVYASVVRDTEHYQPYVERYELIDLGTVKNITETYSKDTEIGHWSFGYDTDVTWTLIGQIAGANAWKPSGKTYEFYSDGPQWVTEEGVYEYETGTYGWYTDEQIAELGAEKNALHADTLEIAASIKMENTNKLIKVGDTIQVNDTESGIMLTGVADEVTHNGWKGTTDSVEIGTSLTVNDDISDATKERRTKELATKYSAATEIIRQWESSNNTPFSITGLTTDSNQQIAGLLIKNETVVYVNKNQSSDSLALYLQDNPQASTEQLASYLRDMVMSTFASDMYCSYEYLLEVLNNGDIYTDYDTARMILEKTDLEESVRNYILNVLVISDTEDDYLTDLNPYQIQDPVLMALYYGSSTDPTIRRHIDRSTMLSYLANLYMNAMSKKFTFFSDDANYGVKLSMIMANPESYYSYTNDEIKAFIMNDASKNGDFTNTEANKVVKFVRAMEECDKILYATTQPNVKEFYALLNSHMQSAGTTRLPACMGGYPVLIDTNGNFKYWSHASKPEGTYAVADTVPDIPLNDPYSVTPGWTSYGETDSNGCKNKWSIYETFSGKMSKNFPGTKFSETVLNNTSLTKLYNNSSMYTNMSLKYQQLYTNMTDEDIAAFWWATFFYGFQDVVDYYEDVADLDNLVICRPLSRSYFMQSSLDKFVPKSFLEYYIYTLRNFAMAYEFEADKTGITQNQSDACSEQHLRAMRDTAYDTYGTYPDKSIVKNIVNMMNDIYTTMGQTPPAHSIVNPSDVTPANIFDWYDLYWLATIQDGRKWLITKHGVSQTNNPRLYSAYTDMIGEAFTYWCTNPIITPGGLSTTIMTETSTFYDPTQKYIIDLRMLPFGDTETITRLQKMRLEEAAFELNWIFRRDAIEKLSYEHDTAQTDHAGLIHFMTNDPHYHFDAKTIKEREDVINMCNYRWGTTTWNDDNYYARGYFHYEFAVTIPMYLWARYPFYHYWNQTNNVTFHEVINDPFKYWSSYVTLAACETLYSNAGIDTQYAVDLYRCMLDVQQYYKLVIQGNVKTLRQFAVYMDFCDNDYGQWWHDNMGDMTASEWYCVSTYCMLRDGFNRGGYHRGLRKNYYMSQEYGPSYYRDGDPMTAAWKIIETKERQAWEMINKYHITSRHDDEEWERCCTQANLTYEYTATHYEWARAQIPGNWWIGTSGHGNSSADMYLDYDGLGWGYWCLPASVVPPLPWEDSTNDILASPSNDGDYEPKGFWNMLKEEMEGILADSGGWPSDGENPWD